MPSSGILITPGLQQLSAAGLACFPYSHFLTRAWGTDSRLQLCTRQPAPCLPNLRMPYVYVAHESSAFLWVNGKKKKKKKMSLTHALMHTRGFDRFLPERGTRMNTLLEFWVGESVCVGERTHS